MMPRSIYVAPNAETASIDIDYIFCASPVPGGNEGLIYEDWGTNGN